MKGGLEAPYNTFEGWEAQKMDLQVYSIDGNELSEEYRPYTNFLQQ